MPSAAAVGRLQIKELSRHPDSGGSLPPVDASDNEPTLWRRGREADEGESERERETVWRPAAAAANGLHRVQLESVALGMRHQDARIVRGRQWMPTKLLIKAADASVQIRPIRAPVTQH